MKNIVITFSSLVLLASASIANAGDAAEGKKISTVCASCHGAEGTSAIGMFPNLAGQHAEYLESALKQYRDGDRENAMMTPMAAGFSDDDIANLAAYFSSKK